MHISSIDRYLGDVCRVNSIRCCRESLSHTFLPLPSNPILHLHRRFQMVFMVVYFYEREIENELVISLLMLIIKLQSFILTNIFSQKR